MLIAVELIFFELIYCLFINGSKILLCGGITNNHAYKIIVRKNPSAAASTAAAGRQNDERA